MPVTAYTPTTTQPITNYIPVLQTASANVARFDHDPVTGESLGLLVEEQRTNLLTYSEDFSNAAWSKNNATITANTVVAPDGTLTADKLAESATTSEHRVHQNYSFVSGVTYSVSYYVKTAERDKVQIRRNSATALPTPPTALVFDLTTGTYSGDLASGWTNPYIKDVGNGWYRIGITVTATASGTDGLTLCICNDLGSTSYAGDGYSGIYIWGAQLESGQFSTSYIPTVASQVTRSADAASMTGTNFSEWYNAGEGTLYGEAKGFGAGTSNSTALFQIDNGSSNNRITLASDDVTNASGLVVVNGVIQASFTSSFTADYNKGCLTYKVNDVAYSLNGSTAATDTNTLLPVVDQMRICSNASGTSNFTIKKLAYYPLRLSNANLQALTGS